MSDITKPPEEIWAFYDPNLSEDNNGADIIAYDTIQHGGQRYIRADLVASVYDGTTSGKWMPLPSTEGIGK